MITLLAHKLSWINDAPDDPEDHDAHGLVEFQVNKTVFVTPEDGEWSLSAAGLYLLRTLSFNHEPEDEVTETNFLFPHCGFSVWPHDGKFKVLCMGCNIGIDVSVYHLDGNVHLSKGEQKEIVTEDEWRAAVLAFVRQIEDFYKRCTPKVVITDELDGKGWLLFWEEWHERVKAAV